MSGTTIFRFEVDPAHTDFDELLWEDYIEHYNDNSYEEYKEYIIRTVPGVANVNMDDALGTTINYIDFTSEKYYTLFMLRWT